MEGNLRRRTRSGSCTSQNAIFTSSSDYLMLWKKKGLSGIRYAFHEFQLSLRHDALCHGLPGFHSAISRRIVQQVLLLSGKLLRYFDRLYHNSSTLRQES